MGVTGLKALPWACCRCVCSTALCKGSKKLDLQEIKHHYLILNHFKLRGR